MRIYEASIAYNLVKLGDDHVLNTPEKFAEYLSDAFAKNPCQESFWVICLDRKSKPISRTMISLGTVSAALVHPREVFKVAVLCSASSIVVAHNHPSGDPAPSQADHLVTRQLRDAAKFMDIELIDHVVVGTIEDDPSRVGYFSFRSAGMI
jgi:DNA repair protein RadC